MKKSFPPRPFPRTFGQCLLPDNWQFPAGWRILTKNENSPKKFFSKLVFDKGGHYFLQMIWASRGGRHEGEQKSLRAEWDFESREDLSIDFFISVKYSNIL